MAEYFANRSGKLAKWQSTRRSPRTHVTSLKEHGQPFPGRPCSPHGNETSEVSETSEVFSVGAGHNRWLRTLLPAGVADLAEASRIEGQSLDGPLGGLGHSPLGAGLPVVSQILRYLRIYLWLRVTRQHASLG